MPFGEIAFRNGDNYEGELFNGLPHGQGTYKFVNGALFQGSFQDGTFHGAGRLKDPFTGLIIIGQFKNGKADGRCQVEYADGSIYEG